MQNTTPEALQQRPTQESKASQNTQYGGRKASSARGQQDAASLQPQGGSGAGGGSGRGGRSQQSANANHLLNFQYSSREPGQVECADSGFLSVTQPMLCFFDAVAETGAALCGSDQHTPSLMHSWASRDRGAAAEGAGGAAVLAAGASKHRGGRNAMTGTSSCRCVHSRGWLVRCSSRAACGGNWCWQQGEEGLAMHACTMLICFCPTFPHPPANHP